MAQGGVAAAHPVPSCRRGGQSGRRRPSMALDRTQHRDDQVRIYAEAQRRRCLRQRQRKRGAVGGRRARRGPPHGQHGARPAPPPHQPVGEPPGGPRESGVLRVVAGAVPENGAHQVRRVRSFTLRAAPARPHPPSSQRCPTPQLPEVEAAHQLPECRRAISRTAIAAISSIAAGPHLVLAPRQSRELPAQACRSAKRSPIEELGRSLLARCPALPRRRRSSAASSPRAPTRAA